MMRGNEGKTMQQQSQTQSRLWKPAAFGGLLLSAVGLYEPIKDIYLKFYDPDYQGVVSVALAEQQLELADRNAECFLEMKRSKVQLSDGLAISYGSCPNNDLHIGVYPANRPAYQRWIQPNRDDTGTPRSAGLIGAAHALGFDKAEAFPDVSPVVKAQVEMKTVCQQFAGNDKRKVWRITDEGGGQCFFERVNLLTGVVEVREKAACDAKCPDEAQKYR